MLHNEDLGLVAFLSGDLLALLVVNSLALLLGPVVGETMSVSCCLCFFNFCGEMQSFKHNFLGVRL